jgi:hypothetical protein
VCVREREREGGGEVLSIKKTHSFESSWYLSDSN